MSRMLVSRRTKASPNVLASAPVSCWGAPPRNSKFVGPLRFTKHLQSTFTKHVQ